MGGPKDRSGARYRARGEKARKDLTRQQAMLLRFEYLENLRVTPQRVAGGGKQCLLDNQRAEVSRGPSDLPAPSIQKV